MMCLKLAYEQQVCSDVHFIFSGAAYRAILLPSVSKIMTRDPYSPISIFGTSTLPPADSTRAAASSMNPVASR